MTIPGQLESEFFKYRKSKTRSVDGSVPGVPYNRFKSHLTPPLSSGNGRPAGYHHDLYMHGNPREYRPNINAPSVDWNDYETYEPMDPHFSRGNTERQSRGFNPGSMQHIFNSMPADDLTLTEQFLQAMGMRNSVEGIVSDGSVRGMDNKNLEDSVDSGGIPDFKDLAAALMQLSKVFPQDHPDIVNLKNAMHQLSDDGQLSITEKNLPETKDENSFNPLLEAEKIFDQQMQILGKSFELPAMENFEIQLFQMSEIDTPKQGLEEIVNQEDFLDNPQMQFAEPDMMQQEVSGMDIMPENQDIALSQIEQAIDQLKEQPLPQEPDPFSMQEDPYLIAQQMFDQQMQLMNNQFMMSPGH